MASVNVTITIPDANLPAILTALQNKIPLIGGETTATYFKRVVGIFLKKEIKAVLAQQAASTAAAAAAAAQGDPNLVTS